METKNIYLSEAAKEEYILGFEAPEDQEWLQKHKNESWYLIKEDKEEGFPYTLYINKYANVDFLTEEFAKELIAL